MNSNVMKYKNFIWPHNPSTIDITVARDLKEAKIPFKGSSIQDFGQEKRIISGRGQFFGDDCMTQFERLFLVFKQGGAGYLSLPGMDSFFALFKDLKLTGGSMPNVVNYNFEFWEELTTSVTGADLQDDFYTVLEGDTLWSIAANFDVSIDTLLVLNPTVKSPNQLNAGEKVRLR